jgi:hypothetical protein
MCTEFLLAILYFMTIFVVNYFLAKLLKSYTTNIFYLLKLKNIFLSFKKSTNNLVFLLSSFFKKEKKNSNLLANLNKFSETNDVLVIGNTYKYLAINLEKESGFDNKIYYFELLANQYLAPKNKLTEELKISEKNKEELKNKVNDLISAIKAKDQTISLLNPLILADTGNNVIKHYSNAGTWIKTVRDDEFTKYPIISLVVDSQKNVHVLTQKEIRVYDYIGNFLFSYAYTANISLTNTIPVRLASSYNREIIYIAFNNQVLKFFRNGAFAGYIIKPTDGINSISSLYHDEYRNLLITSYDKIYKFPDIMKTKPLKGPLPPSYWNLNDLLIHKEEYIQNWVYSKSFQRLWDNIEIFRDTLHYSTDKCKTYTAPIHDKSKMIIGQNEIVTSVVVNRVLGYLWDNFYTLVKHFDPNCK